MKQDERLDGLIPYLINERDDAKIYFSKEMPIDEKIQLFQKLCNVRVPLPVSDTFLTIQNEFLTEWNNERKSIKLPELSPVEEQLYIWQGDITRLEVDGIVNAANSEMLGCMIPNHTCIDNIIHTRAGVQLRLDCHEIMQAQGRKEAAGKAKITKAYNLPASYVIHTVGPFIDERGVSPLKEQLLASCYRNTLKLADAHQLSSIAFCCVSTGEFNFPNERAAEIALRTVREYIARTKSQIQVVFNVFKDKDLQIYKSLLREE